jgi:hypothetical protein
VTAHLAGQPDGGAPTVPDPARHSPYSDPGPWADLLAGLPDDVETLCAAARNVVVHYRAQLPELTEDRLPEVNSRWLHRIIGRDQERFGTSLLTERPLTERVAGCCRDHSLFLTGALRERGVPARNRVGFAHYLGPGWVFDHVVTEYHDGTRWVRTDPELAAGQLGPNLDPRDLGAGPGSPFQTAAEAWTGHRSGTLDVSDHGVFPDAPPFLRGPGFVKAYVVMQVAHRFGDELLLWDGWGANGPGEGGLTDGEADELARLLVAVDRDADHGGDDEAAHAAEQELWALYASDPRLHPGRYVEQASPAGPGTVRIDLVEQREA